VVVAPRFYRPYYSFRPRLSVGFGLWVGYPVVYPYAYEPYPYSYGSVEAQPGYAPIESGVSFEITPATAAVYVDGQYAGTAADFGPTAPPLSLTAGRHHIEVVSPGYRTIDFDVDAIAGQIIPYRGSMEPDRY